MPKLIIMKGLPGSGKTTRALDIVANDKRGRTIRVNRDSLRTMLHGNLPWTLGRENSTILAEKGIVSKALEWGRNVVVDDTNILGGWVDTWRTWAEKEFKGVVGTSGLDNSINLQTEVIDLTTGKIAVNTKECIRRDNHRAGSSGHVGRAVIERMALFGGLLDFSGLDKVAIIDIDGTLANLKHRLYLIEQEPKNHREFYAIAHRDEPYVAIFKAANRLAQTGHTVFILSGRPAYTGHATDRWLTGYEYATEGLDTDNDLFPIEHLFMRNTDDHRPDGQVKRQIMEQMLKSGLRKDAIKVIIDDRDSVCEVWREMELPLIQVKDGKITQLTQGAVDAVMDLKIPIAWN